jgi:hypothetical protein
MNVRFSDARFSFRNVIRDAGVFKAFKLTETYFLCTFPKQLVAQVYLNIALDLGQFLP